MDPKNLHTFNIKYRLDNGTELSGQFTCKRLSIMDRTRMGVKKSQLCEGLYCVRDDDGNPTGQGLDENSDNLAAMLSHMSISIIQSPVWFDLEEVSDMGLIHEIYNKVLEYETSFFRSKRASNLDGTVREGESSGDPKETDTRNLPTEVVGPEVQAALDA